MNVPGLDQVRDRLAAAGVLARRDMVDPVGPDQALRAFVALRRYGAFGGLIAYTAARYGDAPAITHFHAAFTDADPQARETYHRRIATAPPSK
ncbi:MAG TPA: hypothetical protein VE485_17485 [Mycobacterium sp.]|nr:hypothetical protein [Mycobacterium sp.]